MIDWNKLELLDIVEGYAENNGGISSEEELSNRFDNEIAPLVIENYGTEDQPAIDEAFGNWTDSLLSVGEIHEAQYNQYDYIGRYSE